MQKDTTVRADAADRKAGMVLDEIDSFVQACRLAGMAGDEPVKVGTGWRQQIQTLTATSDADPILDPRWVPARPDS